MSQNGGVSYHLKKNVCCEKGGGGHHPPPQQYVPGMWNIKAAKVCSSTRAQSSNVRITSE